MRSGEAAKLDRGDVDFFLRFEGIDIAHKPIKTGEKTIQEFSNEGWLHGPADLFKLPAREAAAQHRTRYQKVF